MKIKRSVLGFTLISAILLVLVVWLGKKTGKAPTQNGPKTAVELPSTETAPTSGNPAAATPVHPSTTATGSAPSTSISTTPVQTKGEQMKEALAEFNDEDVVLYGKVIDQFGSPVAEAEIDGTVQVNNGNRVGSDRLSVKTDGNGEFAIRGYKGKSLGIIPKKAGYVVATSNTSFVYSHLWPEAERYNPDPNNPAVIKMWKLQGAEPLVGIDQHYKVRIDGAPVCFDLLAGKVTDGGGDIKITLDRPAGVISQRQPQDWTLKIEAVDGGLAETSFAEASVTYQAPENNYLASDTISISTTNHWSDLVQRMFFLTSRQNQVYGKVFLSFSINENPNDPVLVSFRGVANANGSRNWEGTISQ